MLERLDLLSNEGDFAVGWGSRVEEEVLEVREVEGGCEREDSHGDAGDDSAVVEEKREKDA